MQRQERNRMRTMIAPATTAIRTHRRSPSIEVFFESSLSMKDRPNIELV